MGSCKDRKSIDNLDSVMNNTNFYGIMNVKKRNANDSKTLKHDSSKDRLESKNTSHAKLASVNSS